MSGYTPKTVIGKKLKCTCGSLDVHHQYGTIAAIRSHWPQDMYYIECHACGERSFGYTDMIAGKNWEIVEEKLNYKEI